LFSSTGTGFFPFLEKNMLFTDGKWKFAAGDDNDVIWEEKGNEEWGFKIFSIWSKLSRVG